MQVKVEGLYKSWGSVRVLNGVAFAAAPGEFVAFVGRSGSGKSTLLHLLAGIEAADRGRILLDGIDVVQLDEAGGTRLRRERIGLVFQQGNLIPTLDVLDNVRLPMELLGADAAGSRRDAMALLERLGLAALARRQVDQLSGGEQQRVAVARALAHRPSLVLADEPTASLDADSAEQVIALLGASCREQGATLLMATHAREVMGLADRLLRLERGQVVAA